MVASGQIIEGGKLVIPGQCEEPWGSARGDTVVVELLHAGELRVRPSRRPSEARRSFASRSAGSKLAGN